MSNLHSKSLLDLSILPANIRIELLDFYEFLIHKYKQNELIQKKNRELTQALFGKYKHIPTSSDLFAKSKQSEKDLEL